MTKYFFLVLLFITNKGYSQKFNDSISFTVVKFKDTILKDERDYTVILKLKNNKTTPIVVWNTHETELYYKAIYLSKLNDTLTNENWYKHADIDYIIPPYTVRIEPKESQEIRVSLFGNLGRVGDAQIKFFFSLSELNHELHTVESDWIQQHFSYSYKDFN